MGRQLACTLTDTRVLNGSFRLVQRQEDPERYLIAPARKGEGTFEEERDRLRNERGVLVEILRSVRETGRAADTSSPWQYCLR